MEAKCKTELSVKEEAGETEFYDGKYLFLRDRGSADAKRYFWRCNQKHHGCNSRLHTLAATGVVVHRLRTHNHSHLQESRRDRRGNAGNRRHVKEANALSGPSMTAQNQSDSVAVKEEKNQGGFGTPHNSQPKVDHAAAKAAFGYVTRSCRQVARRIPPVSKEQRQKLGRRLPSGRVTMRDVVHELEDIKPFITDTKQARASKSSAPNDNLPVPLAVMKRFLNLPTRKLAVAQELFNDLLNEIDASDF